MSSANTLFWKLVDEKHNLDAEFAGEIAGELLVAAVDQEIGTELLERYQPV